MVWRTPFRLVVISVLVGGGTDIQSASDGFDQWLCD